jgi:hypothetical protein
VPRPRVLPPDEQLLKMREDKTYDEIAGIYGVTKSAVAWRFKAMGRTREQPSYKHIRPWRVRAEHEHAHPSLMLRLYGRREAGRDLTPAQERMLDRWLQEVRAADVVIGYDPEFPPNPASPKTGGWFYVKRRKGLDLHLIREPDADEAHRVRMRR